MPDRRAVSLASLGCLRALARDGPVLVAIDDVQWLDPASADVLRFVVRRLDDEPVGVLASLRLGEETADRLELHRAFPGARARRVVVGSMSPEDLGRLIRDRLEVELPHPVTDRIHDAAGGSPFFALEIARELIGRGIPEAGEALPIPDDTRHVLVARLSTLPQAARTILLVAAAAARPTEALVAASSGLGARADAALTQAIDAGVVSLEGDRIRFTHPLLASTVYTSASQNRLRDTPPKACGTRGGRRGTRTAPGSRVADARRQRRLRVGRCGGDRRCAGRTSVGRRALPAGPQVDPRRRPGGFDPAHGANGCSPVRCRRRRRCARAAGGCDRRRTDR